MVNLSTLKLRTFLTKRYHKVKRQVKLKVKLQVRLQMLKICITN